MTWSAIAFYAVLWLSVAVVVSLFLGAAIRRMAGDGDDAPCGTDVERGAANDSPATPETAPDGQKNEVSGPSG